MTRRSLADCLAGLNAMADGTYKPQNPVPVYKNYNLETKAYGDLGATGDLGVKRNYKNYKGLYAKIHSDPVFKEAQQWGVQGNFLYACVAAYGEHPVKDAIFRIRSLADSYFRSKTRPIPQQRGAIFGAEMNKLKRGDA